MADLLLVKGLSPTASEDDLTVPWARDREALQRELGTDEPVAWISHTVGWYLAEAAHELRAISVLLRARTVTGSLGPLVRAVVERVGVTAWILDVEKTDSTERAWRAMLNALVCGSEYRKTVDQLGAPSSIKRELAEAYRDLRTNVRRWFSPQVDAEEPKNATLWTRSGTGFPDLTTFASLAMSTELDDKVTRGMYGAQCGMTHPNIFVLGEILKPTEGGIMQFVHRARDIDKEVRAAFITFTRGVMIWSRYFSTEADFDSLQSRVGDIASRFEAASELLEPEPDKPDD